MDSDGEGSDARTRSRAEDEFELPRVIWVPDSMEDQEDFFPKKRKDDSFHALPCTQTTESSRLLRNVSLETPVRDHSTSTSTATNLSKTDNSTPSGRRPTRRIRSLPSPYPASASTTTSSRRSTIDGSSRPTTHVDASASASPSDRLGSLMSQLGERFSNRNEARKKRAEMQEKAEVQKRIAEQGRAQRMKQVKDVEAIVERQPAVRRTEVMADKVDPKPSHLNTGHRTESGMVKPRHPLAQSDVNHMSTANPARQTASTEQPQKHQNLNPSAAKNHFAQAIVAYQAQLPTPHAPVVPQRPVPTTAKAPPAQSAAYTNQSAPHTTKTAPLQKQILPQTIAPVIVSEADGEPAGQHQNSDTSFESLTDMEGLFDAGGEEVDALFRACDGF